MLKDEDRIFQNLYNDSGADLQSAKLRNDWSGTKDILGKSLYHTNHGVTTTSLDQVLDLDKVCQKYLE